MNEDHSVDVLIVGNEPATDSSSQEEYDKLDVKIQETKPENDKPAEQEATPVTVVQKSELLQPSFVPMASGVATLNNDSDIKGGVPNSRRAEKSACCFIL